MTAAGLANLKDCKNLDTLLLAYSTVNDEGLKEAANLKKLSFLSLDGARRVSKVGLAYLKDLDLVSSSWATTQ